MNVRILIVGGGAVGAFYGSALARSGAEVSVTCRSNHETVSREGYLLQSSTLGDSRFLPKAVLKSAAEFVGVPDYLIMATKVVPSQNRVEAIRPAVGAQTAIVLLQNGVEIERETADAFPDNRIISAVAYVSLNQPSPGVVRHAALGHLAMGNFPGGKSAETEKLAAMFRHAGLQCAVTDNVALSRWQKAVWNGSFNPISVVMGGADTKAVLDLSEPLVRSAMAEICTVAAATGNPLPSDIVDLNIRATRTMTGHVTSMAQDFLRKREMEIDAVIGNIVRVARRHQVAVPVLESIENQLRRLVQDDPFREPRRL